MDRHDIAGLFSAPPAGFAEPPGFSVQPEVNVRTTPSESLSADKYAITVIKTREVVDLNESYRADRPEIKDRLMLSINRLLGFLITQYQAPASVDDVRRIMNSSDIDILNANELLNMSEGLVPVAIVRELLAKHKIAFDPKALPNWSIFSQRYMRVVLRV